MNKKTIDLKLVNNKALDVPGYGIHKRDMVKTYPADFAEKLLVSDTWAKVETKKEKKELNNDG